VTVQLVTSAVRPIPPEWKQIRGLWIVVSIDGLQPDHDRRRTPATYERILKNIEGQSITVHCTVTRQMARREGSFEQFTAFWSNRPEVRQIWFSLFTPQRGEQAEEVLSPQERARVLDELAGLRRAFPKLNLPDTVIEGYRHPPASPAECIFARTTLSVTADLKSRITPCQFGGDPDCSQCGCMASAGMKSIGAYRVLGIVPLRSVYEVSSWIGQVGRRRPEGLAPPTILP
jgi:sulfatase maturation enzyme AslB (radical SAM superfamily)